MTYNLSCGGVHEVANIDMNNLDESLWQSKAICGLVTRLTDGEFPCLFAKTAWQKKSLRFLFCDKSRGYVDFFNGLLKYTDFVHKTPLELRTFSPLIVFFYDSDSDTLDFNIGWEALHWAHNNDLTLWPENIPTDPEDANWSYVFNGVPLFINMSSPKHVELRSRNLGSYLTFVINPRENFDAVASIHTKSGRMVRDHIRSRVKSYNNGHVPQELGFYGEKENKEWIQYQLSESGITRPLICPLHIKNNKNMK